MLISLASLLILGSTHDFAHFSTGGKPAVFSGSQYIAIGTDEPDATQHFLTISDAEILGGTISEDLVACYAIVSEHMSDVKWLDATTLLAATGRGNLKQFKFDQAAKTLQHIGG